MKIAEEVIKVTNWLTEFILSFMKVFMGKYIMPTLGDISGEKIILASGPPIDTVIIPFFADPPINPSRDDTGL